MRGPENGFGVESAVQPQIRAWSCHSHLSRSRAIRRCATTIRKQTESPRVTARTSPHAAAPVSRYPVEMGRDHISMTSSFGTFELSAPTRRLHLGVCGINAGHLTALFVALVACSDSLPQPTNGSVECGSDDECPGDLICAEFLRCIEAGLDPSALRLTGEVTLSPPLVRSGDSVRVTFSTNKIPTGDPTVFLDGAGAALPMTLESFDESSRTFVYAYSFDGSELEGDYRGQIAIPDLFSTTVTATLDTPMVADFSPPTLLGTAPINPIAPPNSPQTVVTAATVGARITTSLVASEPLADASRVSLGELPFSRIDVVGDQYFFEFVVTGSTPEGNTKLTATLIDIAGNQSIVPLGSVIVDRTQPLPISTGLEGAVVLRRAPFGLDEATFANNADLGAATLELVGGTGVVEPGARVRVFDLEDPTAILAEAEADESGQFFIALRNADRSQVLVDSVDGAGNVALEKVPVRDGIWAASFKGATGSAIDTNPHEAFVTSQAQPTFSQATGDRAIGDVLQALSTADGDSLDRDAAQVWRRVDATRFGLSFLDGAFHDLTGEILFFGGTSDPELRAFSRQSYTYDGNGIRELIVNGTTPSARGGHTMAYAKHLGLIILFGGLSASGTLNDTWAFDGDQWFELEPPTRPGSRYGQVMAYDPEREVVVMGFGCSTRECSSTRSLYDDVWEFDGLDWEQRTPSGGSDPAPRIGGAMAFSREFGAVAMHGGCFSDWELGFLGPECSGLNRNGSTPTYLWDGTSWTIAPSGNVPNRMLHNMVDADGQLMLVGGCVFTESGDGDRCQPRRDTWCYSGGFFSSHDEDDEPNAGATVFDPSRQLLVSVGGGEPEPFGGDWVAETGELVMPWEGDCEDSVWDERQEVTFSVETGFRTDAGLAYHENFEHLVLVGGNRRILGNIEFPDGPVTMHTTGLAWTNPTSLGGDEEVPGFGLRVVYDEGRNRLVALTRDNSSSIAQTYELQSYFSGWTRVCSVSGCHNFIPARRYHAMTYDRSRERTVVFGGVGSSSMLSDLRYYNGADWISYCTSCNPRPPARACSEIVYDEARDVLVLFGGTTDTSIESGGCTDTSESARNDLWEWSFETSSWSQRCADDGGCAGPSRQLGHSMIYDPTRARTILLESNSERVFEWDGIEWRRVQIAGAEPNSRVAASAAYDRKRRSVFLFGGQAGDDQRFRDMWELPMDPDVRPAVIVDFDWLSADITPSEALELSFRVVAGGTGYTNDFSLGGDNDVLGTPRPGIEVSAWDWTLARWSRELSGEAAADAPLEFVVTSTDADEIRSWLNPSTGKATFRIQPQFSTGNGPESGRVSVDYADFVIRYRKAE